MTTQVPQLERSISFLAAPASSSHSQAGKMLVSKIIPEVEGFSRSSCTNNGFVLFCFVLFCLSFAPSVPGTKPAFPALPETLLTQALTLR